MPRPNRCQGLLKIRIFNVNTIIEGPWQNRFINIIHLSLKWQSPFSQDGDDFTYMGLKIGMLNISEQGNCSTSDRYSLGDWSPNILFIHFFFQHCSCFHRNTLILIALHKVSSIHPPTKFLLRCLAMTDFCVGVIVQPLLAVFWWKSQVANGVFFTWIWGFLTTPSVGFRSQQPLLLAWTGYSHCCWDWNTDTQ